MENEHFQWLKITVQVAPVSNSHIGDCGFIAVMHYESPKQGRQNWGRVHCKDAEDVQRRVKDVCQHAIKKENFNER